MALTREFKETIVARARRDAKFRDAIFSEAINAYLAGDTQTGKAMLRDLVNATIGFEGLAAEIRKPSKSLHRMLAERGNPSTGNFFDIVKALQKQTRTRLRVSVQATAVMQDVAGYEATQETRALLKILALGKRQVEEGKVVPAKEAFRRARARIARRG
jgi:DNA-binding phage protein